MKKTQTIQRVLLLNPPDPSLVRGRCTSGYQHFEPPLGLLYVFDYLKSRGDLEIRFVDLNIEMMFLSKQSLDQTLAAVMASFRPQLVAIAALYYSAIGIFHRLARMVKEIDAGAAVVFGGHYPTHLTDHCLADRCVDAAVLSEGELGLSDLINALNAGAGLETVRGIAFRKNGKIERNPRDSFWPGFAHVRRLPWEKIPFEHYFKEGRNVLDRVRERGEMKIAAVTATRGCPWSCRFCSSPGFWKMRWRKRKIANIVDEIRFLKKRWGVNTIVFNDENINVNPKWFGRLVDALAGLKITWISGGGLSVRPLNDRRLIERMYASGIGLFNLAIESGVNETLRRVKKPLTVEESQEVIGKIRGAGSGYANGFFVTGFPFESLADVRQTHRFAESLDLDWRSFYCFQPFPGADLFNLCLDQGLIDGFNINYRENYLAPSLRHLDYTGEELTRLNYTANLKCNFVQNRNLKRGNTASLAQAERDFCYVLDMAPSQVFARLGLARVMRLRGDLAGERHHLTRARSAVDQDAFDWPFYLDALNISLDSGFSATE